MRSHSLEFPQKFSKVPGFIYILLQKQTNRQKQTNKQHTLTSIFTCSHCREVPAQTTCVAGTSESPLPAGGLATEHPGLDSSFCTCKVFSSSLNSSKDFQNCDFPITGILHRSAHHLCPVIQAPVGVTLTRLVYSSPRAVGSSLFVSTGPIGSRYFLGVGVWLFQYVCQFYFC